MRKSLTKKQKTAYEIRLSLVGSEMCIRDRSSGWCQVRNLTHCSACVVNRPTSLLRAMQSVWAGSISDDRDWQTWPHRQSSRGCQARYGVIRQCGGKWEKYLYAALQGFDRTRPLFWVRIVALTNLLIEYSPSILSRGRCHEDRIPGLK